MLEVLVEKATGLVIVAKMRPCVWGRMERDPNGIFAVREMDDGELELAIDQTTSKAEPVRQRVLPYHSDVETHDGEGGRVPWLRVQACALRARRRLTRADLEIKADAVEGGIEHGTV